jgi:hypothetical protein
MLKGTPSLLITSACLLLYGCTAQSVCAPALHEADKLATPITELLLIIFPLYWWSL